MLSAVCKNTADFAETLKKAADIGFKTVQVSGNSYEPQWLKEQLDKRASCDLHTSILAGLPTKPKSR